MTRDELVAELRAAAASLITAAGAAENDDLAAAEIGVEDALFRAQSLLSRIQAAACEGLRSPVDEDPGDDNK